MSKRTVTSKEMSVWQHTHMASGLPLGGAIIRGTNTLRDKAPEGKRSLKSLTRFQRNTGDFVPPQQWGVLIVVKGKSS